MVIRALDDTDVAQEGLRRKETGLLVENGAEELVSAAESLHQDISLSIVNHLHGVGHCLQFIRIVNNLELGNVNAVLPAHIGDHLCIAHEGSGYETQVNSLGSGLDSMLINCPCGNHLLADTLFLKVCKYVCETCNHSINQFSSSLITMCIVSRAMTISSSVVIRATFTFESGRESIASSPNAVLAS